MTPHTSGTGDHDRGLQEALVAYLEMVERGHEPDLHEYLARHPGFAAELIEFIGNRAQVDRLAGPLRQLAEAAHAEVASRRTVGLTEAGSAEAAPPDKVRYFGDYELLEEIARGGMGVVYKARQVSLNRLVALKMILAAELASEAQVQRFRKEAEAAARLDHPHIVPIYEVGEHNRRHYFSMRLVEGTNLAERLAALQPDPRACARLLATVARTVHYAHQRGIIHRDLKPGNILIDVQSQPHVTDFGLAKQLEAPSGQSQTGAILGTPSYMAPEQAAGQVRQVGVPADVYALGSILYELLTGRPPFRGPTPMEVLLQVVSDEPVAPRMLEPKVPRDLETICLKCLEKMPRRRYATAEALAEDLERWLNNEPIRARPAGAWERVVKWAKRRPAVAALVTVSSLASALLVVGLLWALAQERDRLTSERLLRKRAEQAEIQERQARKDAQNSERQARSAEAESRDRLVRLHVRDGVAQMERGDLSTALLWFTEALRADKGSPIREEMNRTRIASVLRAMPKLRHLEIADVSRIQLSADARWVAMVNGTTARVWDALTGQPLTPPLEHDAPVHSIALAPETQRAAAITQGSVHLWDVGTGQRVGAPFQAKEWVRGSAAVFSPSGRHLLVAVGQEARLCDARTGQPVAPPMPHPHRVANAVFSPDGLHLATLTVREARIWDAKSGLPVTPALPAKLSDPHAEFSPDGKRLLTLSTTKEGWWVEVWNTQTGKRMGPPIGNDWGTVWTAAFFSADGSRVVIQNLGVWDVQTGKTVTVPNWPQRRIAATAFSPDDKQLATGSHDRTCRVWDAQTGMPLSPPMEHAAPVTSVVFSRDGLCLLTVAANEVRVWQATTGQPVTAPLRHSEPVRQAVFSPDGKRIVTAAGGDEGAQQWQLWEIQDQPVPPVPANEVERVAVSPDGRHLLTVRRENGKTRFRVRNVPDGPPIVDVDLDGEIQRVVFSPVRDRILTSLVTHGKAGGEKRDSPDEELRVWNAGTGAFCSLPLTPAGTVQAAVFSPDGENLLTVSAEKIRFWDARTAQTVPTLLPNDLSVYRAEYLADGSRIFAHHKGNKIRIWDLRTGQQVGPAIPLERVNGFDYGFVSPDGKTVAAARSGVFSIVDAETGRTVAGLIDLSLRTVYQATFSADGRKIATITRDNDIRLPGHELRVWDTRTGQPLIPMLKADFLENMAFSPDGRQFVLTEYLRPPLSVTRLWDAEAGLPVGPPLEHGAAVASVAFNSDGTRLATARMDGRAFVWDVAADTRPAEDLSLLAQLLAGHRIDATGALVPLSRDELRHASAAMGRPAGSKP